MGSALRHERQRSRTARFVRRAFLRAWPLLGPDVLARGISDVDGSDWTLGNVFTSVQTCSPRFPAVLLRNTCGRWQQPSRG
eukprot:4222955-Alexandrium_andersonii.AAC.1